MEVLHCTAFFKFIFGTFLTALPSFMWYFVKNCLGHQEKDSGGVTTILDFYTSVQHPDACN
jgi:hypothetical protein